MTGSTDAPPDPRRKRRARSPRRCRRELRHARAERAEVSAPGRGIHSLPGRPGTGGAGARARALHRRHRRDREGAGGCRRAHRPRRQSRGRHPGGTEPRHPHEPVPHDRAGRCALGVVTGIHPPRPRHPAPRASRECRRGDARRRPVAVPASGRPRLQLPRRTRWRGLPQRRRRRAGRVGVPRGHAPQRARGGRAVRREHPSRGGLGAEPPHPSRGLSRVVRSGPVGRLLAA